MLTNTISAICTQYFAFSEAIKSQSVIMLHTTDRKVVALHKIKDINKCIHFLSFHVEFLLLLLDSSIETYEHDAFLRFY